MIFNRNQYDTRAHISNRFWARKCCSFCKAQAFYYIQITLRKMSCVFIPRHTRSIWVCVSFMGARESSSFATRNFNELTLAGVQVIAAQMYSTAKVVRVSLNDSSFSLFGFNWFSNRWIVEMPLSFSRRVTTALYTMENYPTPPDIINQMIINRHANQPVERKVTGDSFTRMSHNKTPFKPWKGSHTHTHFHKRFIFCRSILLLMF